MASDDEQTEFNILNPASDQESGFRNSFRLFPNFVKGKQAVRQAAAASEFQRGSGGGHPEAVQILRIALGCVRVQLFAVSGCGGSSIEVRF
jgi:hypothetical protein